MNKHETKHSVSDELHGASRREAEAQRRQREAFERQRLLDQRAQEEEQRQHVMAAKRALDRLKTRFALRIYGEATIGLLVFVPYICLALQTFIP